VVQAPSRRDRVRAATIEEIKQTARQLLVTEGPDAVSLRAIGRAMGMTAPALYRYFSSREDLIRHVSADIFAELANGIRAASAKEGSATGGDVGAKLIAACREFRRWALANREEFGLLFGTPIPGVGALHDDEVSECAGRLGGAFMVLFLELWRKQPFPVLADDQIESSLAAQLRRYLDGLGVDLPVGAALIFLRCWVRLYGMVALEVFEHMHFALDDPAPMFEYTLAELAQLVSQEYPPSGGGRVAGLPGGYRAGDVVRL
jgi:AcrR family transcriptional regulator